MKVKSRLSNLIESPSAAHTGDVLILESARIPHARSNALKGDGAFYGNAFVHFRPIDWEAVHLPEWLRL
jgi:hypothetical protein